MIYIFVANEWHYHQGILCKLIGLDCILLFKDNAPAYIGGLETYYRELPDKLKNATGYQVCIDVSNDVSAFVRRNLTTSRNITVLMKPSTKGTFVIDTSTYESVEDAEEDLFAMIDEYQLLPHPVKLAQTSWREFIEAGYQWITKTNIERHIILRFLDYNHNYTKGAWIWVCHYLPNGMDQPRCKPTVFSTTHPSVYIGGLSKLSHSIQDMLLEGVEGCVATHPALADIVLVFTTPLNVSKVSWKDIIYDCALCMPAIWCPSGRWNGMDPTSGSVGGCAACDREYDVKRHEGHVSIPSCMWYYANAKLFVDCTNTNTDVDVDNMTGAEISKRFKDIHIKSSSAIRCK